MTQLMGERHDIARFAKIIQHHIGMHIGDGRMGKGARRFAGFYRCINPALGEKRLGQIGHARIKAGVGVHHGSAGFIPADNTVTFHRQRRVAVPDLQFVQAKPFALELVIAVAEFWIGRHNRIAQRLDHFGFHIIGQVPPGLRTWHSTPAVNDVFFFRQRVVQSAVDLQIGLKHGGQLTCRHFAFRAVMVSEKIQRAFYIVACAIYGEL